MCRITSRINWLFLIPVTIPELRRGNPNDVYSIYPNPASTHFIVQQIDPENKNIENMDVTIYTMYGGLIQRSNVAEGQAIDISQLPVGVYNVLIKTDGLKTESETLIKMK